MIKKFYSYTGQMLALAFLAGVALIPLQRAQAQPAQALMNPVTHTKFVEPLPKPAVLNAINGGLFTIKMGQTQQWLGLKKPNGSPQTTKVWGYGTGNNITYPGPTIRARKNVSVQVKWENKIPDGHILPVDHSIHLAHVAKGVPTVAHLHGGHTEAASDGHPDAWFTKNFKARGSLWVKEKYLYNNDQEAATLWYHDHALGYTRLNVYAGLAGFYLLSDDNEQQLINSKVLPSGNYEREIVIQDRMFTMDGNLFYPSTDPIMLPPGAPNPSVLPEFFGDFILVNGMTWPKLNVEPRKYRFRLLNGSDSRFYILKLGNGQSFLQIGTDNGLLRNPVQITELLLAPGERADVVVDFSGQTGDIILQNLGPDEPFKGLAEAQPPANPNTTGSIMKFIVNLPLSATADATVSAATVLRPPIAPLVQTGATRQLVLFEGLDNYGRLQPLLGTMAQGSLGWFEPTTETPLLNDVEVWEIYNSTPDAHPIHLHLVSFQILDRQGFDGTVNPKVQPQHDGTMGEGGILQLNALTGAAQQPDANERGWKDTFVAPPGTVTRVIAKFDRVGKYVWHCHILSHEDHEMMRPLEVMPGPNPLIAPPVVNEFELSQNQPNPFSLFTDISFKVPDNQDVKLMVYDSRGSLITTLLNETDMQAGWHTVTWLGTDNSGKELPDGLYYCYLQVGLSRQVVKAVLHRL
jgi:spore coat protein A, manganese oxidase